MGYTRFEVEPLTNVLGAYVRGIDVREPLDDEAVAELSAAWVEHKVLFLPDQPMDREQHKQFARSFGAIYRHPYLQELGSDPDIVRLYSGGDTGLRGVAENWHTDVTFTPEPPMGSILRAIAVPEYGGDTMWIDLEAAYDGLSATMQEFLGTLGAYHSAPKAAFIGSDTSGEVITSKHPVIRTHPVSGRKSVFVNPVFTQRIAKVSRSESAALLAMLHQHCQKPEYQVRIHWQAGMIGMWDNRCTQHKVVADNLDALRKMERLTLQGDAPF